MAGTRDLDALCAALRRYLPDGDRIAGVRPVTGGHSNETYVLEGQDRILRLPSASVPLMKAHDVIVQARVYEEVGKAPGGPPVPRIFHICEDPRIVGAPFFVMEQAAGHCVTDYRLPEWFVSASDETRANICDNWISAIGSLARLKPLTVFGEPVPPEAEARRWREVGVKVDCAELVDLFDRLLAMPAPRTGPFSPVHGDCKIANMMFAGGRLTSVLDWELAYNGEPLSDLGYILYFFGNEVHPAIGASLESGMWRREQMIAGWERASGRSAAGIEWYETLAIGKIAAIIAEGYHIYASGQSADPRFLHFKKALDNDLVNMKAMIPIVAAALA